MGHDKGAELWWYLVKLPRTQRMSWRTHAFANKENFRCFVIGMREECLKNQGFATVHANPHDAPSTLPPFDDAELPPLPDDWASCVTTASG